ncbi:hypothetical protein RvY_04976 [Ramazzottius varieornatus]|uniref:G-protein coupled receptors family 1 profile domain-containing protein n=1 Tax=Ramazzottius varieornatus TaxID=947166 RepID=A0A1D1UTF6_RAMVA|nr:hypothetical protein RvY_04976 [Ramazzottius varieornatus]
MFDCSILPNESTLSSVEALKNYSLFCSDSSMGDGDDNSTSASPARLPLYFHVVTTTIYLFIFVVGAVGNFLVFFVVLKYKDMRDNIFHIFLANLSIADFFVILLCVPIAMFDVYTQDIWYLGESMCRAYPFLEWSVSHLSVLTILAISFERFLAIIHPLKAQYVSSRNRSCAIIFAIWIVAFTSTIPITFIASHSYTNHTVTKTEVAVCNLPTSDSTWKKVYLTFENAVFFFIPLCVLTVVYTLISRHLVKDSTKSEIGISAANLRARQQVVVMLVTVVATFFFFMMPFRVLMIWTLNAQDEEYEKLGIIGWYGLLYFSKIMFYMNSASNPIVLYAMSSKFRTKFQHILCNKPLPPSAGNSLVSRTGTLRHSYMSRHSGSVRQAAESPRSFQNSFIRRDYHQNGNGSLAVTPAPSVKHENIPMLKITPEA